MASIDEYEDFDATGLAELVANKDVTPLELVDEAIRRIELHNGALNAVIHPMFEQAREAARAPLPGGPFTGVPFLFKDLGATIKDVPQSMGSKFFKGWKPPIDSELTRRYFASGVICLGKTNTPELGLAPITEPDAWGPCRNPWDTSRTPGGSSGGSGAAIAARIVPMASGGDGGGSLRIPASCNAIFGLKPTRGRTPVGPAAAEGWAGFTIEHVLTRSVRDSAIMLDAIRGHYLGDLHVAPPPERPYRDELGRAPGKLRIAYTAKPHLPATVDPACVSALENTCALLSELGHELVEAAPPVDGENFARNFLAGVAGATADGLNIAEEAAGKTARFDDWEVETWLLKKRGSVMSAAEYMAAIRWLRQAARDVLVFAEDYDVMLNPTLAFPPPPLGLMDIGGVRGMMHRIAARLPIERLIKGTLVRQTEEEASRAFRFIPWTPVYNVTGQPSMSVPLTWSAEGLPIGMMFTGKFGDEATLFRLAVQLEQARPWADKKPPMVSG